MKSSKNKVAPTFFGIIFFMQILSPTQAFSAPPELVECMKTLSECGNRSTYEFFTKAPSEETSLFYVRSLLNIAYQGVPNKDGFIKRLNEFEDCINDAQLLLGRRYNAAVREELIHIHKFVKSKPNASAVEVDEGMILENKGSSEMKVSSPVSSSVENDQNEKNDWEEPLTSRLPSAPVQAVSLID